MEKRKVFEVTFADKCDGDEYENAQTITVLATDAKDAVDVAMMSVRGQDKKTFFATDVECIVFRFGN